MDCEKYIIMMNMLIDGELSSEERKELSKHISECPDCEKRLKQLKIIKDETKQLVADLPLQFHENLMNRIKREEAEKKARVVRKIASLCAAAGIVIVFALVAAPNFTKLYLFSGSKSASGGSSAPMSVEGVSMADANTSDGAVYGMTGGTGSTYSPSASGPASTEASGGTNAPQASAVGGASTSATSSAGGSSADRSDPSDQPYGLPGASGATGGTGGATVGATKSGGLKESGGFFAYYAFYGNDPIPDSFAAEDMKYYPQDNETYLFVKKTDLESALSKIADAGFKKSDHVFPEADAGSDTALIVIFGDR